MLRWRWLLRHTFSRMAPPGGEFSEGGSWIVWVQ